MTEYNLSKSELVQLINTRPTTHVELHAIIEECEDRYSETQVLGQISSNIVTGGQLIT